uniref:CBM6 domain-containing protein n=2 Tax=Macrostomum lignano TaxID=282301 RepID=A0A1I8H8Q3_9PLAT
HLFQSAMSQSALLCCLAAVLATTATDVSAIIQHQAPNYFSQKVSTPHPEITRVHLMFMNHLDVGFSLPSEIGYSANVINAYLNVYFERAANVSRDLRKFGYLETFSYLAHPWMLEMFFDCPQNVSLQGIKIQCPSQATVDYVAQAVKEGAIQWHAGSMNVQYETCLTPNLLQISLDSAKRLDAKFGIKRKLSAVSLRDVPGLTRAAIDLMAKNGIVAVTNGINWACPSVDLGSPDLKFVRWRSPDTGNEIFYNKIPGGYPGNPGPDPNHPGGLDFSNCLQAPGTTEIQCWAFRSDNSGPPVDYKEVLSNYEVLRGQYPNAAISASTMEKFWSLVLANRDSVPVFTKENGDTWLQGDQADFHRMARYRAIARALDTCVSAGACQLESPDMIMFSRWIAKAAEHTYGLNGVWDYVHYSNLDFYSVMQNDNFRHGVSSWLEQRQFLQLAVDAAPPKLASYIAAELAPLADEFPGVGANFSRLNDTAWGRPLTAGGPYRVVFDRRAGLARFSIDSGATWHQGGGAFVYRTYNESDTAFFLRYYTNPNGDNTGFGKYNSTQNAHPVSQFWSISAAAIYQHSSQSTFAVQFLMDDPQSSVKYGAPASMWAMYNFTGTGYTLHSWSLSKTPTRLMEAFYIDFPKPPGALAVLNKLGHDIAVGQVAANGSVWQHMVGHSPYSVAFRQQGKAELRVQSLDSSLACPRTASYGPTVWPVPMSPVPHSKVAGISFNMLNNVWDVNFVFWYPYMPTEANFRARFRVDLADHLDDLTVDGDHQVDAKLNWRDIL